MSKSKEEEEDQDKIIFKHQRVEHTQQYADLHHQGQKCILERRDPKDDAGSKRLWKRRWIVSQATAIPRPPISVDESSKEWESRGHCNWAMAVCHKAVSPLIFFNDNNSYYLTKKCIVSTFRVCVCVCLGEGVYVCDVCTGLYVKVLNWKDLPQAHFRLQLHLCSMSLRFPRLSFARGGNRCLYILFSTILSLTFSCSVDINIKMNYVLNVLSKEFLLPFHGFMTKGSFNLVCPAFIPAHCLPMLA